MLKIGVKSSKGQIDIPAEGKGRNRWKK